MKKLLLLPMLLPMLFALAFAYSAVAETDTDYDPKAELKEMVSYVIELHKEGYSKEEITEKLSYKNKVEYKKDVNVKDDYYKEKKEYKYEKKANSDYKKDSYKEKNTDYKAQLSASGTKLNYGQYKKAIRQGDDGEEVKEIQELINKMAEELGLDTLEVDGKYGPATARIVRLIQLRQGLDNDGIVGPQTLEKLYKMKDYNKEDKDYDEKED